MDQSITSPVQTNFYFTQERWQTNFHSPETGLAYRFLFLYSNIFPFNLNRHKILIRFTSGHGPDVRGSRLQVVPYLAPCTRILSVASLLTSMERGKSSLSAKCDGWVLFSPSPNDRALCTRISFPLYAGYAGYHRSSCEIRARSEKNVHDYKTNCNREGLLESPLSSVAYIFVAPGSAF